MGVLRSQEVRNPGCDARRTTQSHLRAEYDDAPTALPGNASHTQAMDEALHMRKATTARVQSEKWTTRASAAVCRKSDNEVQGTPDPSELESIRHCPVF